MTVVFKCLGIIILFISLSALGFYAATKTERHLKVTGEFIAYITELRDRILYEGSELSVLIQKVFGQSPLIELKDGKITVTDCGINKTERKIVEDFFIKLGSTECQGEISRAELCISLLRDEQSRTASQTAEKSKLYRILGVCGGILGCILFI